MGHSRNNNWSYDTQVLYYDGTAYAVRSTNASGTSWGEGSYWGIVDSKADYVTTAAYVWYFEPVITTGYYRVYGAGSQALCYVTGESGSIYRTSKNASYSGSDNSDVWQLAAGTSAGYTLKNVKTNTFARVISSPTSSGYSFSLNNSSQDLTFIPNGDNWYITDGSTNEYRYVNINSGSEKGVGVYSKDGNDVITLKPLVAYTLTVAGPSGVKVTITANGHNSAATNGNLLYIDETGIEEASDLTMAVTANGITIATAAITSFDMTNKTISVNANTIQYSTDDGANWTDAGDLNVLTASGGAISTGSSNVQVRLLDNQALNNQIKWSNANTLTITAPSRAVTITRYNLSRTTAWLINTSTGTVNLGSADDGQYAITFQGGGHADDARIFKELLGNESTGRMFVTNCTFENFKFANDGGSNDGYLWRNKNANGRTVFKNLTVNNCVTTKEAFIQNRSTNNDQIYLQGSITITNCTGTHFHTTGRLRLGEIDGSSSTTITASTPLTVYWAGSTTTPGTPVVAKATSSMLTAFSLTNTDLALFGTNTDLKLTQAYTLTMNAYCAATLVLPFASTIPTDATCYTLNYTAGKDYVKATEVETTLPANTPVLVNAAEGSYKFVSTATSGDAATGSGTHTSGALTGVYTSTSVPASSYILWANATNPIGFYLSNSSTVAANRAYLTADGAGARMSIAFGDETSVSEELRVKSEKFATARVCDLQGRHVEGSRLKPGLYIVNGKKIIIK